MNGRFFLDTNAIIQLLKGNIEIGKIIEDAEFLACSVISELKYVSFPGLSDAGGLLLAEFISRISVTDITHDNLDLKIKIADIRKTKKVKLPDAIIVASARQNNCQLITADKDLLKLKDYVDIIDFIPIV